MEIIFSEHKKTNGRKRPSVQSRNSSYTERTVYLVVDSSAPERGVCDLLLLADMEIVAAVSTDLSNATNIQSAQVGTVRVQKRPDQFMSCREYFKSSTSLNLLYCSRIEDFGVSTTIDRAKCMLKRSIEKTTYAKMRWLESDALFLAELVSQLQPKAAPTVCLVLVGQAEHRWKTLKRCLERMVSQYISNSCNQIPM